MRQLLKGPPPGNVRITVGPVIGKVTEQPGSEVSVDGLEDVRVPEN